MKHERTLAIGQFRSHGLPNTDLSEALVGWFVRQLSIEKIGEVSSLSPANIRIGRQRYHTMKTKLPPFRLVQTWKHGGSLPAQWKRNYNRLDSVYEYVCRRDKGRLKNGCAALSHSCIHCSFNTGMMRATQPQSHKFSVIFFYIND